MKLFQETDKGSSVLEFTFSSIPLIFVIMSIVQMSLAMWNYHTLNETVKITTRIAALRGIDCASSGCSMTVGQYAQILSTQGIGLATGSLDVKLTDANGAITCYPLTSCTSSTTVWPRSGGNAVGQVISISASYPFTTPISMFAPGHPGSTFGTQTFVANSQQAINY